MNPSSFTRLAFTGLIMFYLTAPGSLQAQEASPKIAVLPIQGNGVSAERRQMLDHRLRKLLARKYKRSQVAYELVDSNNTFVCHNARCAAEKGRLLNVEQVMYGQIRNQQNEFSLEMTIVDTRTGTTITSGFETCTYCDYSRVLKTLAPDALDEMKISQGPEQALIGSQLAQWENFVGHKVMFDYPADLELKERAFSHKDSSYFYLLKVKDESPFHVTITSFNTSNLSNFNAINVFKDGFRKGHVLNENSKVSYTLGNKQVEGIPFMSKPGGEQNPNKGIYLLFENNFNLYEIQLQTPLTVTPETERVVNQFFTEFLKTVYVE